MMQCLSAKAWKILRPLAQTESVISHNSLNLSNTAIKLLKFQISNDLGKTVTNTTQ
jgi:hypothetical protein